MKRAEALKHFEEEYWDDASLDMKEDTTKYIEENRKELTTIFIENFRTLCKKIKAMQDDGKKAKIAYITYSFDVENLLKLSREYTVQAYGTEWFYEESEECKITYDVNWLYNFLDGMYNKLLEISKKYVGKINSADMDKVWTDGIKSCDVRLLEFAKKAIKEAVETDEFKAIDKEEVLEIRLGQHKGYNEIIHKIDTRVKDSKEIKEWLESGEKSYSFSIVQNLDLSDGDYKGITCQNTDFSGSNLSNSNFEEASLIESIFFKSVIDKTNFNKARLAEANFSFTIIKNSSYIESNLIMADFTSSEFISCDLSNSKLYNANFSNCIFSDSNLSMVKFGRANLENANLSGIILRNAEFSGTNLKGINLSRADLTGAKLSKVDLTQTVLDGAIFSNNKIKEVKIKATDVKKLNLSEEQRKELIIIG